MKATSPDRRFTVSLRNGDGETKNVTVYARTREFAADMAEKCHRPYRATSVLARFAVAGRCGRCGAMVFADDHPKVTGEGVKCLEC
jgi:hypothetical protein